MSNNRAQIMLEFAVVQVYEVATADIAANIPVKFGAADNLVVLCAADDPLAIGIARVAGAVGECIEIVMMGTAITKAELSGTATRGLRAKCAATGLVNATLVAAGTTLVSSPGIFLQSGVVGDVVPLLVSPTMATEA